jgi:hypothetical protein
MIISAGELRAVRECLRNILDISEQLDYRALRPISLWVYTMELGGRITVPLGAGLYIQSQESHEAITVVYKGEHYWVTSRYWPSQLEFSTLVLQSAQKTMRTG